jgi:dTDP-4-amino-4,6-dideoxygalactose transaminase
VTSDVDFAGRAEVVREKGTDRSRFIRDEVDHYTWQEVGSSYLMSDLLASLVASQWPRLAAITAARAERFQTYQSAFAPLAADGSVTCPTVPPTCKPAFHIYYLLTETAGARDQLAAFLRQRGIEASSHYVPLHLSPYAQRAFGTRLGMLPVTEHAAERLLRLPLYPSLARDDHASIIDTVFAFFGRRA